jgi:hypothetical protein
MTTNPYAYYEDEPLPVKSRVLSVSSDGSEEADMEPRCPLELKGNFIAWFRPAVFTYQINVQNDSFECRLPNGEFLQLTREEARKYVSVHGNEIDIVLPWSRSLCFRCIQQDYLSLTLARLKVWLQPTQTDPNKAYHAVAKQLLQSFWGAGRLGLYALYLVWLAIMIWRGCQLTIGKPVEPAILFHWGVVTLRLICFGFFSLFILLRLFGRIKVRLFLGGALLSLIFPILYFVIAFVPSLRVENPHDLFTIFDIFDVVLPIAIYGIYHRFRASVDQLQRENGLI